MTTSTQRAIETLATMVRRDNQEVLLTDSRPPPSPTSFNPSILTQGSWTTKISGLPTAIAPPSSTSSSVTSGSTDTGSLNHGTSISLILLLSLSVAVIIWILSCVLINRRRRAGGLSVPRLWPSFFLFTFSGKGRAHFTFRTKRSDSRTSLLPSGRLAAGAELGYREMPPGPGNGRGVGQGQTAVAAWTRPPPVELDGQGIGDPPIRADWVSRMSSFLATGRGGKGHHHRRMDSSLRATRSIRESFGEKINDPGVAVLIREPRNTLSRYSRAISEKALPEIPESEETVPTTRLSSPRRHWERTASRNTFGSLKGGSFRDCHHDQTL
ncbi:hypothetical protein B0H65DRAFT_289935 [Neurospora tetraspora]|uniref:Uncharacterized protein n=1 Tax=Neurospora tetraspora TaxID=94610 RepID=A0AAE0MNI2_9PEZI|nr:hypothetical protein B0H65DRAFT_289935 [Neurospora tetraspora]